MNDDFVATQTEAWAIIRERFSDNETANGPGSTLEGSRRVREGLADMLSRHRIGSMLDAPCGDSNWIRCVDLTGVDYVGWDVDPGMLAVSKQRNPTGKFAMVNLLTAHHVPRVDLILCRDFMIHLPNPFITAVLLEFLLSGSHYLLATNHPTDDNDAVLPPRGHDDRPGYWHRAVNLEASPFDLAGRVESIREDGYQELVLFDLEANR